MKPKQCRLLWLILSTLCLLMACQPTPEAEPVIGRGQTPVFETANGAYPAETLPAERLQYTKDRNGLKLIVDAEVVLPDTAQYAIAEVTKRSFQREDFEQMLRTLVPNAGTLYSRLMDSRQELMTWIVALEEENNEENEPLLAQLRKQMEQAPDGTQAVLQDVFQWDQAVAGKRFYAYGKDAADVPYSVSGIPAGCAFSYSRNARLTPLPQFAYEESEPRYRWFQAEPAIAEQDAREIAEELLDRMGIGDMALAESWRMCAFAPYSIGAPVSNGWWFIFTRTCHGLPSYYVDGAELWDTGELPAAGAPWEKELLFLTVDQNGVLSFDWRGAGRQTGIVSENAALLPFEEILERVEKQLMYRHLPYAAEHAGVELHIHTIRLGTALVNLADTQDTGWSIPAWDICYDLCEQVDQGQVSDPHVLTLNALDGSYIEPRITMSTISEYGAGTG